ncbi:MAG: NifU N-terminal domain-containing protein [Candidatus Promineifilaceae bacterium]
MSEYIEIEQEETDDPHVLILETNIKLSVDEVERYDSAESMLEGSPFAQSLAYIPGIVYLEIDDDTITITRDPSFEWYTITEDIKTALVDFFL